MPIRNIPKNYRNVTGVAARSKANGKAMFESTLERDFITLLEFDRAVASFEVQPVRLNWRDDNGKIRTYTPDLLATYQDGRRPTLWEVKYRDDLRVHWEEYRPKFRAAVRFAREQGWRFRLVTEKEIRGTQLENVKFLLPFLRRRCPDADQADLLVARITELGCTTPDTLLAPFGSGQERAQLLPVLWYLVAMGAIGTDLGAKLTMASSIWRVGE